MLFRITFLVALIAASNEGFAQSANIWYFGNKAGIDFNYSPPEPLTNSAMSTLEGCASYADGNGKLLFYTDGNTVWNRYHFPLKNGAGLKGHNSSTQSAVIIPKPGSQSSYYIFTVDGMTGTTQGCHYSEVDMNQDGGNGGIVLKNVPLISNTTYLFESIGSTLDKNGVDYWVSYMDSNTKVKAFHVTDNGVNTTPVISQLLPGEHKDASFSNYMKFSSDNKMMAVKIKGVGLLLCKFDNETGKFSKTIRINNSLAYSMEFSPNSKFLYTNDGEQYDVSIYDSAAINDSKYVYFNSDNQWSSIQLGPDQRIYGSRYGQKELDVIESPNSKGSYCEFKKNAFYLGGRSCLVGLPTFVQTSLLSSIDFENYCLGDSTIIRLNSSKNHDSLIWDFGDNTSSKVFDKSKLIKHQYRETGAFEINVQIFYKDSMYYLSKLIQIYNPVRIELGDDRVVCTKDTITLVPQTHTIPYIWQDGSTDTILKIYESGNYWVASHNSCFRGDTVFVDFSNIVELDLGKDTFMCEGDSIVLVNQTIDSVYVWQDGSINKHFVVKTSGQYSISKYQDICFGTDTVLVLVKPYKKLNLRSDTALCAGDTLQLTPRPLNVNFQWHDGTTRSNYVVNKPGLYFVEAEPLACYHGDTVKISYLSLPSVNLGPDTTICEGFEKQWTLDSSGGRKYIWQDNSSSFSYSTSKSGNYSIKVSQQGCISKDSVEIEFIACKPYLLMPNIFTPNGDSYNETLSPIVIENVLNGQVFIYNRWGESISNYELMKGFWDGTSRGQLVPDGEYFYVIYYYGFDKMKYELSGVVTVIR